MTLRPAEKIQVKISGIKKKKKLSAAAYIVGKGTQIMFSLSPETY